jgi:hypothetical protein
VPPLLQGPFDRWVFASRRPEGPAGVATLPETVIAALALVKHRDGEAVIQMGVPSPEDAAVFAPLLAPAGAPAACITASPHLAAAFLFAMLDAARRAVSPMRPERNLPSLPVAMVVKDASVLFAGGGPFAGSARRLLEAGWTVREVDALVFEERQARPAGARLVELSGQPATPHRQEPRTQ